MGRNNLGIARAPPGRLGATPWAAPEGQENNKSLENNAGSGSRARPALGINICYGYLDAVFVLLARSE